MVGGICSLSLLLAFSLSIAYTGEYIHTYEFEKPAITTLAHGFQIAELKETGQNDAVIGAPLLPARTAKTQMQEAGTHIPANTDTPRNYSGTVGALPELVWQHELSHSRATFIAIHFTDFDLGPGDYLTVSDPEGGQAYRLEGRGKMDAGTFWAQHVRGDTVLLELTVTSEGGGRGFRIDEYVAGYVDLGSGYDGLEAICDTDDKENAVCYQSSHPTEYDRGRSVARLLINGSGLCTGWLASSEDHLITNEHCITSASDALNTDYEFMSEAPTCGSTNCQMCYSGTVFSGATFIKDSATLDYALVQINSGNPADTYGYLGIDNRTAVVGEQIYIPQHPGGRAKEFAIFSTNSSDTGGVCRVYSLTELPCSGSGGGYNDLGYYADTEGNSSGSPVLATSSDKVIALHHCADCPNRGVPINLIYPEISDYLTTTGLQVTPKGLDSEGPLGGPFSPGSIVYTLENLNDTGINYSVSKGESWVSINDTGGSLAGHTTTDVTVSINSNANSLSNGSYTDTINFINTTDHTGDTTRGVTLTVGVPSLQYSWNMDTNPGWTTQGLWAWGAPTGGGGQHGGADPTNGYTGSNVYGYNLSGDYENDLYEKHLTSNPINCSTLSSVSLKFQRWLGVESPTYDVAYVKISNNGATWTTLWQNFAEVTDASWILQNFDISSEADGQSTVYLRWTMGTTDGSYQYCGWNIDDVEIWGIDAVSTCPDCPANGVISNVTYPAGKTCSCSNGTSIILGSNVTVESGAIVTFAAPIVTVQPGFHGESGSTINIKQ